MARLETDHERISGVTLVRLVVESDAPASVTIDLTHDGPVWPPRRQGVPAAGWTAEGWSGVVEPDAPRALGYATPATIEDRPATIAEVEVPPEDGEAATAPTARDLVRTLGDASPPRDAIPDPTGEPAPAEEGAAGRSAATEGSQDPVDGTDHGQPPASAAEASESSRPAATDREAPRGQGDPDREAPRDHGDPDPESVSPGVEMPVDGVRSGGRGNSEDVTDTQRPPSLDAAAERIELAERLATASSAAEAQAAVREAGGIEGVRALAEQVTADRQRLAAYAERSGTLAERAAALEIPVEALARVA